MHTYPEGLPLPQREGYGFAPVSPIKRSNKVSGRATQRRLYSSVPTLVSVSWLFDSEEASLFEGFCKWEINWGDFFLCPVKSPRGLQLARVRFTDEFYQGPDLVGIDMWRYTAVLELFEMPVVNEAEYASLLAGMDIGVMNAQLRSLMQRWYTKSWPGAI